MVVRTFLPYQKTVRHLPYNKAYPSNPETLGEHIKKRRMEQGLLQREVAEIIGASEDVVTYWENGRSVPQIHFYPKIFAFLGYVPFALKTGTLGERIYSYRILHGLSCKAFGKLVGVDQSTVGAWEHHHSVPSAPYVAIIERLIAHTSKPLQ